MSTLPKANGAPPPKITMLVHRARDDEDDEEQFKPLEWGLILRLWGYTAAVAKKRNWLVALTILRSAQLPALSWLTAVVINGPITHQDLGLLALAIAGYAVLAIATDGIFHFRQRFAL